MLTPLGLFLVVLSIDIALLLGLLLLRRRYRWQQQKQDAFMAHWEPLLMRYALGQAVTLPALARRDQTRFLQLWHQQLQHLKGPAEARLQTLLHELGLVSQLPRWLKARQPARRLLAIQTLGALRVQEAWEPLVQLALNDKGLPALLALRALLLISPEAAVPVLMQGLRQQQDWPRAHMLGVLRRLPSPRLASLLADELQACQQHSTAASLALATELVRLLEVLHFPHVLPALRESLNWSLAAEAQAQPQALELGAACLQALSAQRDHAALPLVLRALQHPHWLMRLRAANALRVLGSASEIPVLLQALADPNWWVRYRAAEALHAVPGIRSDRLQALQQEHPEPVAREILAYYQQERQAA